MENVWIFSGEFDADFAGEAMFYDDGGVNQIGGDDSVGKQPEKEPTFDHSSEESTHPYIYITYNYIICIIITCICYIHVII